MWDVGKENQHIPLDSDVSPRPLPEWFPCTPHAKSIWLPGVRQSNFTFDVLMNTTTVIWQTAQLYTGCSLPKKYFWKFALVQGYPKKTTVDPQPELLEVIIKNKNRSSNCRKRRPFIETLYINEKCELPSTKVLLKHNKWTLWTTQY